VENEVTTLGLLSWVGACKELIGSNKCLSWEDMSFKFGIGRTRLCEDWCGGHNPRDKDDVLLKLAWVVNKELDRMGVTWLGLLTYDYKSTWSLGLWSHLRLSPKVVLTNKSNP